MHKKMAIKCEDPSPSSAAPHVARLCRFRPSCVEQWFTVRSARAQALASVVGRRYRQHVITDGAENGAIMSADITSPHAHVPLRAMRCYVAPYLLTVYRRGWFLTLRVTFSDVSEAAGRRSGA